MPHRNRTAESLVATVPIALALLTMTLAAPSRGQDAGVVDPDWHGAAGLLIPLEQDTPIRLQVVHAG